LRDKRLSFDGHLGVVSDPVVRKVQSKSKIPPYLLMSCSAFDKPPAPDGDHRMIGVGHPGLVRIVGCEVAPGFML
jgi:hypothetical protein